MWSFIQQNSGGLNVVLNLGTLLVWVSYFQILFVTFRMQNRPNLLINRSAGNDTASHCIISNMSASSVYVQAVMLEVTRDGRTWQGIISDTASLQEGKSATEEMESTAQGPLGAGEFLDLGKFSRLVRILHEHSNSSDIPASIDELENLRITLFAIYTAKSNMIGAARDFAIRRKDGETVVEPHSPIADQLANPIQRRHLQRKLANA